MASNVNVKTASSVAFWSASGVATVGASLTGLTVMFTVSVSVSVPPAPVWPRSLVARLSTAAPW